MGRPHPLHFGQPPTLLGTDIHARGGERGVPERIAHHIERHARFDRLRGVAMAQPVRRRGAQAGRCLRIARVEPLGCQPEGDAMIEDAVFGFLNLDAAWIAAADIRACSARR